MKRILAPLLLLSAGAAAAGEVVIEGAEARKSGGLWRFSVTLSHADEGWDHYADAWRVTGPDGAVYGERVLLHPHVDEQPFTRTLAGVAIPAGVTTVHVEAHDKVHGWSPRRFLLTLLE